MVPRRRLRRPADERDMVRSSFADEVIQYGSADVHRRRGGALRRCAARRRSAARQDSPDRIPRQREPDDRVVATRGIPSRPARAGLDRGPERRRSNIAGRKGTRIGSRRSSPSSSRPRLMSSCCPACSRSAQRKRRPARFPIVFVLLIDPVSDGVRAKPRTPRRKHDGIGLAVRGVDHQAAAAAEGGCTQPFAGRASCVIPRARRPS